MTLFDERPIRPMLCKAGEPFDSEDFVFEPKWDGLRLLVFKTRGTVQLQNRNLRNVTAGYPELQELGKSIRAKSAILDGEAVVLGKNGAPDFHLMQNRFGIDDLKRAEVLRKTLPVTYVAFDLLHVDGVDLLDHPLLERKKRLRAILREGPHLLYGDHVQTYGTRFCREVLAKGFEGCIAKRLDSPYLTGTRAPSWLKVKGSKTVDCIVVGFTRGEGAREPTFGSLVLAAYDGKGKLRHLGNVGGGFDYPTLQVLKSKLARLERKASPFAGPVEAPPPVSWVRPNIVVEVRYLNMTADGKLRFPRFVRVRTDKTPTECQLDL